MNVMPEQGPSPQQIRNAAALATEATGEQSVSDVFHVIKNRIKHGGYGSSYDDLWTRGRHGGPIQFEGPQKRGYEAFLNIRTLEDASRWSGTSIPVLKSYIGALTDPAMQRSSAAHVGRALEFRGSPRTLGKRLPNTVWRGTDHDNQFLTGPDDPQLSKPAVERLSDALTIKYGSKPEPVKQLTITKTKKSDPLQNLFKLFR